MQTRTIESAINNKVNGVKSSLDFANRNLQSAHQHILDLKSGQVTLYQKIATVFLLESPKNDDKQIQLLIAQLQALYSKLTNRSQELEQLTLDCQKKVSDILSKIDELVIKKVMLLENDPDYASLFNQFQDREDNFQNETNAYHEAQKEFSQKLTEYSQNRCYNYLIKRRFGEEAYRGFWVFRNLDAWAARFINFRENYKNQKILELLLKESQRRYDDRKNFYQSIVQKKEQKEQAIENQLNIPQLREALTQTEQILANYKRQKENIYRDLNQTKLGQGSQFYEISSQLSEIMQRQSLGELENLTLQTKSTEDDILLQKLSELNAQIQQAEDQLPVLKQNCESLEQIYSRFNRVFFLFKQNNIPSDFYEYSFSPASLNELLDRLFDTTIFPETVVQAMITNRTRININRPSSSSSGWSASSWGASSSSSRSSSRSSSVGSSSRSSSRSGFSTTSSSGGGGFKTTDSF